MSMGSEQMDWYTPWLGRGPRMSDEESCRFVDEVIRFTGEEVKARGMTVGEYLRLLWRKDDDGKAKERD